MWTAACAAVAAPVIGVWAVESTTEPLAQYGAVGVTALLALVAVRELFKQKVAAHDADRARADRLEDELRKLNALIQERMVTTLQQASLAIQEAMGVMKERR